MRRTDHSFALALTASLAIHAVAMVAVFRMRSGEPPAVVVPDVARIETDHFGMFDGRGNALNAAPGEVLMVGRDAKQSQGFLSRDPVGPGEVGEDPTMSVLPPGEHAAAEPSLPRPPAAMFGVTGNLALPLPRRRAASNDRAADPAVMTDLESDPFSPGNAVIFRDGRVDVQLGRKVKTVRPRLTLTDRDEMSLRFDPHVVVRVKLDAEGAVRLVEIVESTVTESVAQAVKVALYQWWFEPRNGRRDDVEQFSINWR